MIVFESIPSNIRTNFVAIELGAGTGRVSGSLKPQKVLLIGGRTSSGNVAELTPTRVTTADEVSVACGPGSTLHNLAQAYFANGGGSVETWFCSLADDASGTQATRTITFTGAQTEAGTLYLYIQGRRLRIAVSADTAVDTLTAIAAKVVAAVNALTELPVTAANALGVVTLTAKNDGESGKDIDVRFNYAYGERTPAGLSVAIGAVSGGANNPDITGVWTAIGDEQYDIIACVWNDATTFDAIDVEAERRWGPTTQNDGFFFLGLRGTFAQATAFGAARNSKHVCLMPVDNGLDAPLEFAGALAAIAALAAQSDPARPFQLLEMKGMHAPALPDRWTFDERNLLLFDGCSTYKLDGSSRMVIDRLITTYQRNNAGADDDMYLDVFRRLTMTALRYDFRTQWELAFPRAKLSNDDLNVVSGVQIVTPKVARAQVAAIGMDWQRRGLIQDFDAFMNSVEIDIDTANNRCNILFTATLMGGLIVTAARIQFEL